MSRRICVMVMLVFAATAVTAVAQTVTTTEVRSGTVVAVYDNNVVVRMSDGVVRDFDVPEDFLFDMADGRKVSVRELKPGMKLKATIKTTTKPQVVKTTEVRQGTVVQAVGGTVMVRTDEGVKKYKVPRDFRFNVEGRQLSAMELRPGMKLTATIVHTEEAIVTEEEVKVAAREARQPRPKPAPRPMPAAAPAAPAVLPATGSLLPLAAAIGLALIAAGLGLGVLRRL